MYKSHLLRLFKSKYRTAFIILFLILPSFDLVNYFTSSIDRYDICNPLFAFFLGNLGLLQPLIIWLLPIYLLIMIADDIIPEYKTGYSNIMISKVGKKSYLKEKLFTSFYISFLVMVFAMLIDLLFAVILLHGETYSPYENDTPKNLLYTLSIFHPLRADLGFTLVAGFLSGLAGMMSCAVCILLKDRKYAYPAAFGIWFAMVIPDKSLVLVFQPYSEYGFAELIPIFLFATAVMLAVSILIYIYEVKYVEI